MAIIPPRPRFFRPVTTAFAACTAAMLTFPASDLKAINPETDPPRETLLGGNHSFGPFIIPFTQSFRPGVPVTMTGDYTPGGGGPDDPPPPVTTVAASDGGSQSEGSSAQQGTDSCSCECTSCDALPTVTPLIGGGDSNSTGVVPDTLKLTEDGTTPIHGGFQNSLAAVAVRLGGNRQGDNDRAAVPKGSLFHVPEDMGDSDRASPVFLRAQFGMGGILVRDNTNGFIRQWLGDRHLIDIVPDESEPENFYQGYAMRIYTWETMPSVSGGFYVPVSSNEVMRIRIEPVTNGLHVTQLTVTPGAMPDEATEMDWTFTRTGSSPNFEYQVLTKGFSGSGLVDLRRHTCTLYSVTPPKYTRVVEDYLNSTWTTVFKCKEEWTEFTLPDSRRYRITLQERYAGASQLAERRVWTYYDTDPTDKATYGRAATRRDYGFDGGGTARMVHWENYSYATTTSYDAVIVERSHHGSAENVSADAEKVSCYYLPFTPESGYTLHDYPERPLTVEVLYKGKIARSYVRDVDIDTMNDEVVVTESNFSAPSTPLTSVRQYFGSGSATISKFRPKRFSYPDGTVKTWQYSLVDSMDPHGPVEVKERHGYTASGTDYLHRQIRRIFNRQGFQVFEEVSRLDEDPVDPDVQFILNDWSAYDLVGEVDAHGRPTVIGYNGGELDKEELTWGCCGLEFHRGRNGSVTAYMIDKLKRVTSRTEHYGTSASLAHTTSFLPFGGGAIGMKVEQKTGGLLDSRTHYDAAARVFQVDQLDPDGTGEVSTTIDNFATSAGLRQVEITYPDASTEVRKGYGDGSPESITGSAVPDTKFEYSQTVNSSNSAWLDFTAVKTIRRDTDGGTSTTEYSITHRDLLGRVAKVDKAKQGGVATTAYDYDDATGQLVAIDSPGVLYNTLFAYNSRGERFRTAIDLNDDDEIDLDTDRVEEHTTDIENAASVDSGLGVAIVQRNYVYLPGDSTRDLVSARYSAGNGLRTRSESYPTATGTPQVTTWVKFISGTGIDLDAGDWKELTAYPDSSYRWITYDLWRNATEHQENSSQNTIATTTRTWHTSGRKLLASVTDARTGETTFGYTDSGHLTTSTLTGPSPDLVTQAAYDHTGRVVQITHPDSTVTNKKYTAAGHLWKEWGSQSYSVRYSYDEQGRMKTMATFRGNTTNAEPPDTGGSPDLTTWNYESATGRLEEKVYADSSEVNYTYDDAGRLSKRTWARTAGGALETTYNYTDAGDLLSVDYSDSTKDVLYSYYRTGQLYQVKDGTLSAPNTLSSTRYTHTYTWTGLQANQETIAGIHHETKVLTRKYQTSTNVGSKTVINRSAGYEIGVSATPAQDFTMTYGYDTAGRISTVANASDTFTYGYQTNAPHLVSSLTGPVHTAVRTYEPYRDVLASITNTETDGTSSTISKYTYTVNKLGQRTDIVREGSAFGVGSSPSGTHFDHIDYNLSGEVTSSNRFPGSDITITTTPVTGHDYDWAYDGIGNRDSVTKASATTDYTANQLNQYSSITPSGGSAWSPVHDADGNLTQDQDYDYTYDAENRLIQRTPRTPSSGKLRMTFTYDYRGRRVSILSEYHTGSAWDELYDETILYDGWNPVMHYSWAQYAGGATWRNRSYTWGLDISGTFQGAGGVGGLLSLGGWLYRGETTANTLRYYYTFDGNGNVSEIINYNSSSSYALAAHFEYDAFGNLTRLDDNGGWSIGRVSPFRFSTKWHDNAHFYEQGGAVSYTLEPSKLYYYGYRYYAPQTGRWINRDTLGELGGINLHGMLANRPVGFVDLLGREPVSAALGAGAMGFVMGRLLGEYILFRKYEGDDKGSTELPDSLPAGKGKCIRQDVPECTIVIFVGHGTNDRRRALGLPSEEDGEVGKAELPNLIIADERKSSAATAIGCHADYVKVHAGRRDDRHPRDQAPGNVLPGFPLEEGTVDTTEMMTDFTGKALLAAKTYADELCAKGDCKEIRIKVIFGETAGSQQVKRSVSSLNKDLVNKKGEIDFSIPCAK